MAIQTAKFESDYDPGMLMRTQSLPAQLKNLRGRHKSSVPKSGANIQKAGKNPGGERVNRGGALDGKEDRKAHPRDTRIVQ